MELAMTTTSPDFRLVADYEMTGDQPQAVDKLTEGLQNGQGTGGEDR